MPATAPRCSSPSSPASSCLGLALAVDVAYEPPLWVHFVIFLPLALIVCLGLLRPLKGLLIASQYKNKAAPGRLDGR